MQAVIDAYARGIDVQILLERNVYWLPKVNIPIYSEFQKAWIPVKYTDSYRFTFTHSKFWIIDNIYFISTGNFTKSFFESNRDFIFYSSDRFTLDFLSQLFLWDMSYLGVDRSRIPDHLVLSPIDARAKIWYLLNNAQKDIKIYTQTLSDPDIINILKKKKKEWTIIHICTANNESNQISSSGSHIPWVFLKKPYLHGKIVFVDWEDIFIWSQNFTTNSLNNNREVGIIFSNSWSLHDKLMNYFQADCIFE
jgi:phosphatidylserine/phosphatidylglycerophosphate/cardiolipin synthase-like enzyme